MFMYAKEMTIMPYKVDLYGPKWNLSLSSYSHFNVEKIKMAIIYLKENKI